MHYRKIVLVFIAFAGCVLANDPDPEAVAEDVHPEEEDEEVVIDPDKSPDCAYWADEGECTSVSKKTTILQTWFHPAGVCARTGYMVLVLSPTSRSFLF